MEHKGSPKAGFLYELPMGPRATHFNLSEPLFAWLEKEGDKPV